MKEVCNIVREKILSKICNTQELFGRNKSLKERTLFSFNNLQILRKV